MRNQNIEDLNSEWEKRDQRILTLKGQLEQLSRDTKQLIAEATTDYINLQTELSKPIIEEMRKLEEEKARAH